MRNECNCSTKSINESAKKKIVVKIKYTDYYSGFDFKNDFIWQFLVNSSKYEPIISEEPDFLVYSVFGDEHLKYDCVKIFYTGEQQTPDFNLCDYAIGFDYLTYSDRYFRLPIYYLYKKDYFLMREKHLVENIEKEEFCSFVYSNAFAMPIREQLFDLISHYKKINSGGRYKNNIGGAVADKLEFEKKHKFSIAIENVSCNGYTTEKLVQAFAAGCIPIYCGDPSVAQEFNEEAFINVQNFDSIEQVLERIKEIDSDDNLYHEMMRAPALLNMNAYEETMFLLEGFLENIFSQTSSDAFRRTRQYWNRKYINKECAKSKAYNLLGKVRGFPRNILKKLFKR